MNSLVKKLGIATLGTSLLFGIPGCSNAEENSQGGNNSFSGMFGSGKEVYGKKNLKEINLQNFKRFNSQEDLIHDIDDDPNRVLNRELLPLQKDSYSNKNKSLDLRITTCYSESIQIRLGDNEGRMKDWKMDEKNSAIYLISPKDIEINKICRTNKKLYWGDFGGIYLLNEEPEEFKSMNSVREIKEIKENIKKENIKFYEGHKNIRREKITALSEESIDYILNDIINLNSEMRKEYTKETALQRIKEMYVIHQIPFLKFKNIERNILIMLKNNTDRVSRMYLVPEITIENDSGEKEKAEERVYSLFNYSEISYPQHLSNEVIFPESKEKDFLRRGKKVDYEEYERRERERSEGPNAIDLELQ
jgi:hypothetical protein